MSSTTSLRPPNMNHRFRHHRPPSLAACAALMTLLAAPMAAAQTRSWTHNSEADFRAGTLEGIVVANTGGLRLSRQLTPLLTEDGNLGMVLSLAYSPDGSVYLGTAPNGRILRRSPEGELTELLALPPSQMVTALHVTPDGYVIAGISGDVARVVAIKDDTTLDLLEATAAQYVWAIAQASDPSGKTGPLYIATGPEGQLFTAPAPDRPARLFLDLEEDNLLSLAIGPAGEIYVGTDPRGLVYRIDPETRRPRVLLDSPEAEIVALGLDRDGNLYAAASVASEGDAKPEFPERGLPDGAAMPDLPNFPDNLRPPPPAPREQTAQPDAPAPTPPPHAAGSDEHPDPSAPALPRGAAAELTGEGSAVYRIDPEGFAVEVFRAPTSLFDLALDADCLYIATGPGGQLYELNLATDEVTIAARANAEFITALLLQPDRGLLVATGNTGGLSHLSPSFARQGVFTSSVLDAGHAARFGMVRLDGSLPTGTRATLSTRSGNTDEPTPSGWSDWSEPAPVERFNPVTAPVGRYLQYRLTLFASADGTTSPQVREVELAYRVPNLPPKVSSVTAAKAQPAPETPKSLWTLSWEAEDANGDTLEFSLEYRPVAETAWRPLRDKLTETTFNWDTREVPDGRYQVRVIADDARSNPPAEGRRSARMSRAFLIDNTPPRFGTAVVTLDDNSATIRIPVSDLAGIVRSVAARVGPSEQWQIAESGDKLFDSPQEDAIVVLRGLLPGRHVVRLRAEDDSGNEAFETVIVSVPGGAGSRQP